VVGRVIDQRGGRRRLATVFPKLHPRAAALPLIFRKSTFFHDKIKDAALERTRILFTKTMKAKKNQKYSFPPFEKRNMKINSVNVKKECFSKVGARPWFYVLFEKKKLSFLPNFPFPA
jgi:hypothetical protein